MKTSNFTRLAIGAALLLILFSFVLGGVAGLIGMSSGLAAGALGAAVLWATVLLMRDASAFGKVGIGLTVIGFLLKFPVLFAAGYLSWKQGTSGIAAFTVGAVVVYCALVWRALRAGLYSR